MGGVKSKEEGAQDGTLWDPGGDRGGVSGGGIDGDRLGAVGEVGR